MQYSRLSIVFPTLLLAVAELRGFHVSSIHVKFGIAAIFVACIQPVNSFLRPPRQSNGEQVLYKRIIWEYLHIIVGRYAIAIGIATLFTGMKYLGDMHALEDVHGLSWAMIIWFLVAALIVSHFKYCEKQKSEMGYLEEAIYCTYKTQENITICSKKQMVLISFSHLKQVRYYIPNLPFKNHQIPLQRNTTSITNSGAII
ncbi:unnamed protein product [Vicia faba]|uniref:Cytochrome b561 domain-containing protein n=1 Tax=Vicia faba TaxID=3906 RepID=A0AAV1A495_VICFA|nr:unnamed protein product [Vicia faba]